MSEVEAVTQEPVFAAFVGIDWADKKHVWCLRAVGSEKRESGELEHTCPRAGFEGDSYVQNGLLGLTSFLPPLFAS